MTKTFKILSTISFIAMAIVLTFVGVWAITDLDFAVGGDITYTAPVPETKDESEYPTLTFTITGDTTCEVVDNGASGVLVIPSKVLIASKEYIVTTFGEGEMYEPGINGAFAGNANLTSVEIPDTITSIGEYDFYSCSNLFGGITSVTIGSGITSIGNHSFYLSQSLSEVNIKATSVPTGGSNMFDNCSSSLVIYVPTASVDAYKSAEGWSDYADKIQGKDFN